MLVIEYSQDLTFGVEFDIKSFKIPTNSPHYLTPTQQMEKILNRFNRLYPDKVRTTLFKSQGGYVKLVITTNIEECSEVVKTVKLVALLDNLKII